MNHEKPKTTGTRSVSGRRKFLRSAGQAVAAAAGAAFATPSISDGAKTAPQESFPTPDYDWSTQRWAYGIDATRCIGCLRCVEACKAENNVDPDAHHFRTWVERYVYLEGEDDARVDSQSDPANIAASGTQGKYRFDNRYENAKVVKAFFVPKICNHCERPSCVQVCPVGATFKTRDGAVLIDHEYCIGCRYCIQACPYGARFFDEALNVSEKCTWCYHRITKGLQPVCVDVCPVEARIFGDLNDPDSSISDFVRDNRVQVLKPETGNSPMCFYKGIDREVR